MKGGVSMGFEEAVEILVSFGIGGIIMMIAVAAILISGIVFSIMLAVKAKNNKFFLILGIICACLVPIHIVIAWLCILSATLWFTISENQKWGLFIAEIITIGIECITLLMLFIYLILVMAL